METSDSALLAAAADRELSEEVEVHLEMRAAELRNRVSTRTPRARRPAANLAASSR
jgi:hypothetical protein